MWLNGGRLLTSYYFELSSNAVSITCYHPFYANTTSNVNPAMLIASDVSDSFGSSGVTQPSPSGIAWAFLSDDPQPWLTVQLSHATIIVGLTLGRQC